MTEGQVLTALWAGLFLLVHLGVIARVILRPHRDPASRVAWIVVIIVLPVIGILARRHCEQVAAAHSSGKKLIDVADVIIDNHCPPGDCVVELEGLDWRTGPTSTVTGGMIINMIRCETARLLLERKHKPVLLPSHQFVGNQSAEDQLEAFYEAYRTSLRHLYE